MNIIENPWKHVILRALVISGIGVLVGSIFYRSSVFIPTMRPFQFTVSSISAGIAYAFLKSSMRRHLLPALFIWYVVLTGLLVKLTWWALILNLTYISGVACAILIYSYAITKPYSNRIILRIIYSGAIMSSINCLIMIALAVFSLNAIFSHFSVWLSSVKHNAELGAIIGLAFGLGIEIAEYLNGKLNQYEIALPGEDEIVHKTS